MNNISELVDQLKHYNSLYRKGTPEISDDQYDKLIKELTEMDPDNDYLRQVEPESLDGKLEVTHPSPMLSTDKAYTKDEIQAFINRVHKIAIPMGFIEGTVQLAITAKLDGMAGRDDGATLVTRGNGLKGSDVTDAFAKGVLPVNPERPATVGEIVMKQSYFDTHLADKFEHPRNVVVGLISADSPNEDAQNALDAGAVEFVQYSTLSAYVTTTKDLISELDEINTRIIDAVDYPTDGIVIEVISRPIKESMGENSHHHKWQIAFKTKGETAKTKVNELIWQIGRTGKMTPVLEIDPVKLSGATISRVTAHNAGIIMERGIGVGVEIEIIRSGEVIPKIENVITPVSVDDRMSLLPTICPSCGDQSKIQYIEPFLYCKSELCSEQYVQQIFHWFKNLGTSDNFGLQSIRKILSQGLNKVYQVYMCKADDFEKMGFGPGQAANLEKSIQISLAKEVEDWRWLASFGIHDLGNGDSRKLLKLYTIPELLDITESQIKEIRGFGDITSKTIAEGISNQKLTIQRMLQFNFNIIQTKMDKVIESPISGKNITFTGSMKKGKRGDMENHARSLGANITGISKKSDYLVCGEKVGVAKSDKATKLGITMLSEDEYLNLIGGS